jgi:Uma2 family endonuclease
MATAQLESPAGTLAELLDRLGDIPPERIRTRPAIGTASEGDVIAVRLSPERRLCELVEGVLVEKTMGTREALLAGYIVYLLWDFLKTHDLGIALGADGYVRLLPGLVRIPDVCFISWDKLPERKFPAAAIADLVPDLAVEVLSESNTKKEMDRKLAEYFQAGVALVWFIDPETRTAEVIRSLSDRQPITADQSLQGEPVLPGFTLSLAELFQKLPASEEQ